MIQDTISIRGAREHNLKNINIDIPLGALIVITGLSGSGKSSLAFDTLYAEGQRRYVESLSAYARQFLDMMSKPDVDSIEGLSPAISIEQKTTTKNPRSTVGTITEIYDYMRLLWARVGIAYSPTTGKPIQQMSVSQMVDNILNIPSGTKILLLSPIVRKRKGEYRKTFTDLQKRGFQRVRIDGDIYTLDAVPTLDKSIKHTIEVIVDRITIKENIKERVTSSVETALLMSDGLLLVQETNNREHSHTFSANFSCAESGFTLEEIEPRIFSFNSPIGACVRCDGLGKIEDFTEEGLIARADLSLKGGAIPLWHYDRNTLYYQTLRNVARHFGVNMDTPWKDLPSTFKQSLLYGTKEKILFSFREDTLDFAVERPFEGIVSHTRRRLKKEKNTPLKEQLLRHQRTIECPACSGYRLKPQNLTVKIAEKHIGNVTKMTIEECLHWFDALCDLLSPPQQVIAEKIVKEIKNRLIFLNNVGLNYLTLSRNSGTLSGGESQRIRLASQIGSGLTGVLYVLDEPSIGLHKRDNARLLATLKTLKNQGNTVIMVEHDEDAIRAADHVIDMGLGAGIHGGSVIASGSVKDVIKTRHSLTAQYLSGKKTIDLPKNYRSGSGYFLKLMGATENNLKNVDIQIPLGTFTCVTGVSGSGKSTLILKTLKAILSRHLMEAKTTPGAYKNISGMQYLDKIIDINQSPIGRTPRSNPATYTGTFTPIREWFSTLPQAKARGYSTGRFSFNVKGGRCENCKGDGVIRIEMHFLPDVYVTCDQCKGKRYNRDTLEITHKGSCIADVLDMSIDEASHFFKVIPHIYEKLQTLQEVGLGYIKLGQQATTLSGGESQRIKLSKELSRKSTGNTLYILDEPTTGLHFEDIRKLLAVLHTLVNNGNTVIVIEHNLNVIKTADWIIDMGPEGGNKGGEIIATGTPRDILETKKSHTAQHLKQYLKTRPRK